MTSMERILRTVSFKEPDRVPFLLLLTMHGARELNMSIEEYFSHGDLVAEGQVVMQEKYGHDCYYPFFYASLEVEAWGGQVIYSDDGPPLSGNPIIRDSLEIERIQAPGIADSKVLGKALKAIEILKRKSKGQIPIIGVAISPFSIPIMQMGFDRYIDLIYSDKKYLEILLMKNLIFSIQWANAQIEAGADLICYFDPMASSTMTTTELYVDWGKGLATEFIENVKAPVVTHLASGRGLTVMNHIHQTGTVGVGVSTDEDLAKLKNVCDQKMALVGNLNGVEMRSWTKDKVEGIVKNLFKKAGKGGGYILSDNHGEIPFQVPEKVLKHISHAVKKWGRYPLDWVSDE